MYSTRWAIFDSNVIFLFIGFCLVLSLVLVISHMKDVIKERNEVTQVSTEESDSESSSQRAIFVIMQGIYLVRTEPLIFFGIWGSVI